MLAKNAGLTRLNERKKVEMLPGIYRITMSYNDESMLCYFTFEKGASIPLHKHEAVQNGFVIKGKVRFLQEGGESIITEAGDGYIFGSNELHGSEVLEDTELIECFTPMRPEYVDD
jgi:quercetin dioxygenase-like cupin family protein